METLFSILEIENSKVGLNGFNLNVKRIFQSLSKTEIVAESLEELEDYCRFLGRMKSLDGIRLVLEHDGIKYDLFRDLDLLPEGVLERVVEIFDDNHIFDKFLEKSEECEPESNFFHSFDKVVGEYLDVLGNAHKLRLWEALEDYGLKLSEPETHIPGLLVQLLDTSLKS